MILQKLYETGGYSFVGNENSDLPFVFATCFQERPCIDEHIGFRRDGNQTRPKRTSMEQQALEIPTIIFRIHS